VASIPFTTGKMDVENGDVRLLVEGQLHRPTTNARFRAYFKVSARFTKRAQAAPHDRQVVGN
jgi:hypothetical protein